MHDATRYIESEGRPTTVTSARDRLTFYERRREGGAGEERRQEKKEREKKRNYLTTISTGVKPSVLAGYNRSCTLDGDGRENRIENRPG